MWIKAEDGKAYNLHYMEELSVHEDGRERYRVQAKRVGADGHRFVTLATRQTREDADSLLDYLIDVVGGLPASEAEPGAQQVIAGPGKGVVAS